MKQRKGYTGEKLDKMHKAGYYDYLCSDEFKPAYKLISDKFKSASCTSILDVGCWNGMFYRVLQEDGFSGEYLGFDLSASAIDEAKIKYGNSNTLFEVRDWNYFTTSTSFNGIYFGGVFYYIQEKVKFIRSYIEHYSPKIIAIQDLQNTDLSEIDSYFKDVETFNLTLNVDVNEARQKRQIKIIKL
jgi:SAM-dependent methyltransferase